MTAWVGWWADRRAWDAVPGPVHNRLADRSSSVGRGLTAALSGFTVAGAGADGPMLVGIFGGGMLAIMIVRWVRVGLSGHGWTPGWWWVGHTLVPAVAWPVASGTPAMVLTGFMFYLVFTAFLTVVASTFKMQWSLSRELLFREDLDRDGSPSPGT